MSGPLIHDQSRRISDSLNEDSTMFRGYVHIKSKPNRQKIYLKKTIDDEALSLSEKDK